ncbi:probable BOI-related E3 ubiquitin-protein ligase 3 [Cucurbita moschata]|uniref:Probable BOI-related E3 ubiquitin-protein ligase 3 n=1 Tax=Cucurbita moschata TaxID=3662 RepID=A0A6J1ERH5_CUCMO|nr:probable BOI-related E3 ubiquitin-protein ligase 3 [Cucurbita moschata]
MAVQARHLNLFHPQLIGGNREFPIPMEGDANIYNTQVGYGLPLLSGTTTAETLLPPYNSAIVDSVSPKTVASATMNSELPLPRKRSRECMNRNHPFASYPKSCGTFSFLGEDISPQIQQQQLDIDRIISQHLEKVRSEVEEKRNSDARRIMEAMEVSVMKRLKAKEEEMEKMGKLNWALEERVKCLCIENEAWRDMAQTNEDAVNTLRRNLEVACKVKEDRKQKQGMEDGGRALVEEAQSSCGSNEGEGEGEWRVVENNKNNRNTGRRRKRWCRRCGKEAASVVVLPCRHLCLCSGCGSWVHVCPICKSSNNASVHVNMSPL